MMGDSQPRRGYPSPMRILFLCSLLLNLGLAQETTLLPGAHAHNDYEHERPLLDALSHGFQSVEADIFLIGDALLVAHDRDKVDPKRDLKSLYLDPLRERVRRHRGHVYADSKEPFYLLIDLKSEGESTYRALHKTLTQYQEMLTEFREDKVLRRGVTVIISGNRPRQLLADLKPRIAAYDGRLGDLETADPKYIPWISDNWGNHFQWRGSGPVPDSDREKLMRVMKKAHARELQVRFWAIPDKREAWQLMRDTHVDFINTDRLEELSQFLQTDKPEGD